MSFAVLLCLESAVNNYLRDGETADEQRLLNHLLAQYEPSVRPVLNSSHTITVKLGLTLTNIFDMVRVMLLNAIDINSLRLSSF
jgi:hypothetical protein